MGRLSVDRVLKDHRANDATSVSALSLTHRALSNVSCLAEFKNLRRLDLGFNGLTTLEDLRPCSNLKWLFVVQNQLESLKGGESLSKLTVLNAGKNKLTSMDEVRSLGSLRALILNDNEIASICKLDQMKELNTLILSRNLIQEIGKSLVKVTYHSKLSLSNCQIYDIGTALKFCTELRELRLAHNHIKALPAELAHNTKLSNFDLGNNLFTRWSDMEVLKSLVKLKNLNLLGNPITENDKSMKKIRKVLPELKVFIAKPTNQSSKIEKYLEVDLPNESRPTTTNEVKSYILEKEEKEQRKKREDPQEQKETMLDKDDGAVKRESKKPDLKGVDMLDDTEAPFIDLIETESANTMKDEKQTKETERNVEGFHIHGKKKKSQKGDVDGPLELPSLAVEIGMGVASTWNDQGTHLITQRGYVNCHPQQLQLNHRKFILHSIRNNTSNSLVLTFCFIRCFMSNLNGLNVKRAVLISIGCYVLSNSINY